MTDIVEVRKVNKDGTDGQCVASYLSSVAVPPGPCQMRKEEKIPCKCFSTTRYQ